MPTEAIYSLSPQGAEDRAHPDVWIPIQLLDESIPPCSRIFRIEFTGVLPMGSIEFGICGAYTDFEVDKARRHMQNLAGTQIQWRTPEQNGLGYL